MQALLEDDYDDIGFGGRPKDKVSATELLDALKEKYVQLSLELGSYKLIWAPMLPNID